MGTTYDGELFARYKNNSEIFIETGSYIGDGIQSALNAGFDNIVSIEIAKGQYDFCLDRFKDNNKVKLILGDTRNVLKNVLDEHLKNVKNVFFWLDAHCSGGGTGGENIVVTLPKELEIATKYITKNNINAVLAIDDVTPELEVKIANIFSGPNVKFLGKEPCINPYTNFTETDRIIVLYSYTG